MLNNPLKNPLKEDKIGTFIFKYKRVRKGRFSNLFSYSVLLLSFFILIGCSSDSGGGSSTTTDTETTDTETGDGGTGDGGTGDGGTGDGGTGASLVSETESESASPTVPTEDRRSIQASTPMGTVSFNPLKLQRLFMYAMVPQEPQVTTEPQVPREQAARTAW